MANINRDQLEELYLNAVNGAELAPCEVALITEGIEGAGGTFTEADADDVADTLGQFADNIQRFRGAIYQWINERDAEHRQQEAESLVEAARDREAG